MAHCRNLPVRTLQSLHREEVAGLVPQFPSYHILIYAVISGDPHMADMSLGSLEDTHLQVNGVLHHIHHNGIKLREDITIIIIQVSYGIVIHLQPVIQ